MKFLPYEAAVKEVPKTILSSSPLAPMFLIMQCLYPEGLGCDYHSESTRSAFHAMLVLSGHILFQEIHREEQACTSGTVLIIPKNGTIRWRAERETEILHCLHTGFNLKDHGVLGTLFGALQEQLATVHIGPERVDLIERRLAMAHLSKARDLRYSLAAYEFMGAAVETAQTLSQTASLEKGHSALARCLNYIEHNLHRELSLEELSKHAYLGVSRISQLFRENLDVAPLQYIARRKAEAAERMLCESGLGVGEVAEKLGFNSISYFSRFFKRQTGRNPSTLIVR